MPRRKATSNSEGGSSSHVYAYSSSCGSGYNGYPDSQPTSSITASGKATATSSGFLKVLNASSTSAASSKERGKKRKVEAVVDAGVDVNGEPVTPKPKRTRKKKDPDAPVPEKRGAIFKSKCPQNIIERFHRVISQRFFLIDRHREGDELREEFSVLGSTGNVYVVTIDKKPSCTCPDAMKGNHCKHILFVYTKVLQVPQSSHVWYQKALLTSELEQIFRDAPPAPGFMANARIRDAYNQATGKASSSSAQPEQNRRALSEDDSCAICYESMHETVESLLTWCQTCGNALHKECFQQWARRKSADLDCVYCRAPWALSGNSASGKSMEGYVNLAGVAGLSPKRDTSTYYHGPRTGHRYYGYQDYDD